MPVTGVAQQVPAAAAQQVPVGVGQQVPAEAGHQVQVGAGQQVPAGAGQQVPAGAGQQVRVWQKQLTRIHDRVKEQTKKLTYRNSSSRIMFARIDLKRSSLCCSTNSLCSMDGSWSS